MIHFKINKKLSYRWQTARCICARAMAWLADLVKHPPYMCYHANLVVLR